MKQCFYFLMAAIGLLLSTACSNEDELSRGYGNEALVSFNVELSGGMQTKAISDGTTVNNLTVKVFDESMNLIPAISKENVTVSNKSATVNINLVKGKTYSFLFWASVKDNSPYTIGDDGTITVSYNGAKANDESRDAFLGVVKNKKVEGSFEENVTLKRPFAQLNFLTDDIDAANKAGLSIGDKTQSTIKISKAATTLNPFTNTVSGEQEVTFAAAAIPAASETYTINNKFYRYLGTTYFLVDAAGESENAGKAQAMLNSASLSIEGVNDVAVTNVPAQWNYRTNIYGSLLTATGKFNVTIEPDFDKPDNNQMVAVATVDQVDEAIKNGATDIVVTEAPTQEAAIIIPKQFEENNTRKISLTIPQSSQKITINYDNQQKEAPKEVAITAPTTSELVIDLPQSTVTLNEGTYTTVTATTAANTLIIPEGVKVGTLTVKKGNVKLYGVVNNVERGSGYNDKIYRCIGSQASFENLKKDNVSGYTEILIEECIGEIDGGNTTLTKPMTVSTDVTIKNIRMDVPKGSANNSASYYDYGCCALLVVEGASNAIFENVVSKGIDGVRAFLMVGDSVGVTAKNCTFIVPIAANKAGFNIHCKSDESVINANFENCLISVDENKLNSDKNTDYEYTDKMKQSAGAQTRGISIGRGGAYTGKVNLNMTKTVAEGISYVINVAGCNVFVNANINDCVLDGRAALNLRGNQGSKYVIKNSKLIGRNWFGGPSEVFATIVYGNDNSQWATKDQVVSLSGTEVVAYSNPQTDTNWQYLADMRSTNRNRLELLNASSFRELGDNPRLDYLVDVEDQNPEVSQVVWDETFRIQGKDGATVLKKDSKVTY